MRVIKHGSLVIVHIAIYALLWCFWGASFDLSAVVFAVLLVWVSCRDFTCFEVPDLAAGLLIASGFGFALSWQWAVVGAAIWALVFLIVRQTAARVLHRSALGLGDVKLMAGLGAWLGPIAPVYVTLFSSIGAIVTLATLAIMRGQKIDELAGTGIAFGPFLCLSAWAVWLGGSV